MLPTMDRHVHGEKDTRLRAAVETVYSSFVAPIPETIEGCPCCITTRQIRSLLTKPLRSISGAALWRYVSGVFLTVGEVQDFRYFLPRIFEVSAFDRENANEPEVVLGKLKLAEWRSWPLAEQHVIEEFVDAWFEHELAKDLKGAEAGWIEMNAESVLCGAARAGFPLRPWLIRLCDVDAAPVLEDMKSRYPGKLSAFWEFAPQQLQEFATILDGGSS